MITTKLITLANIQDVKSISLNVNETKQLSPYILEAQNFDLRELIGDAFYLDLIADFIAFKKDEVPILIECKEKTDTIKHLQIFQNNRLAKQYGFKFQIHQDGKEVINNIEQSNNTDLF